MQINKISINFIIENQTQMLYYGGKVFKKAKMAMINIYHENIIITILYLSQKILLLIILGLSLFLLYKKFQQLYNLNNINNPDNSKNNDKDEDPSSGSDPEDIGLLAGIYGTIYENRYLIGGVIVTGLIIMVGGYVLLNHYNMFPSITNIFGDTSSSNNINSSNEINTNNVTINCNVNMTANIDNKISIQDIMNFDPSITMYYIPEYFNNLQITPENFESLSTGYETYLEYKKTVFLNHQHLYNGVDPSIISIYDLRPKNFIKSELLMTLRKYTSEKDEIMLILREIAEGVFEEEQLVGSMPKLINAFNELLLTLQKHKI